MQITNKCTNNAGQTVDHTKHDAGIQVWVENLIYRFSEEWIENFVRNEKTNEKDLYGDDDSQQGLWLGCGQCCAAAFGQ
ncbi:hypothetical protein T02_14652 [Trichinella nativa]|uniref:Uncharacterized protein n=1 Tax=Trichinella nativa TaxID=6335 RepID=A0A0V1LVG5_9BILA|nr:hypothetical protein T02_14652 [Trichinella nativa]